MLPGTGSCGPSASASAGPRLYRASAGGSTGQRQRSQVTTEPFAEELRGCVRDLKAQLAERDSALTAAGEELAAVRAQVEKLDNEKETTQGVCSHRHPVPFRQTSNCDVRENMREAHSC